MECSCRDQDQDKLCYTDSDWPVMMLNVIGRACATGTLALCYVISAEIYPTVVRNIGLGSSSFWVRKLCRLSVR